MSWRTGINGSSLFAAQGNKQGLFLASLERYRAEVGARLNVLEHGERGLDDLVAFVGWLSEINSSGDRPLGCLMVNTMVEFGTAEPSVTEQVDLYRQKLTDSIQATLVRASRLGESPESTVAVRTKLVRAGLFGALVIANVASSKDVVDALAAVRHEVESWRDNEASAGERILIWGACRRSFSTAATQWAASGRSPRPCLALPTNAATTKVVAAEILSSAHKHEISDDDMRHAFENAVASITVPNQPDFSMIIGPDESGRLLEIGIVADEDNDYVIHAMPARPKYLKLIRPHRGDQP